MLQSTPIRFACYKPMELGVGGATRVAPPKCVAPPQSSRLHSGVLDESRQLYIQCKWRLIMYLCRAR